MKRKILLTAAAMFFFVASWGQEFNLEDKVLNLGIGLGSTLYSGTYYNSTVPPVSASFEIGVADDILDKGVIGVGGYLGYASYKWEYFDWGYKYTDFILGARGNFHYPLVDKLDTYTGLMLGYEVLSEKEFGSFDPNYNYSGSSGGLITAWYIGGRYFFSDSFAAMAELGYGITYLNLGISLKI